MDHDWSSVLLSMSLGSHIIRNMACSRSKLSYIILGGEGITENNENVTTLHKHSFSDFHMGKRECSFLPVCLSLCHIKGDKPTYCTIQYGPYHLIDWCSGEMRTTMSPVCHTIRYHRDTNSDLGSPTAPETSPIRPKRKRHD